MLLEFLSMKRFARALLGLVFLAGACCASMLLFSYILHRINLAQTPFAPIILAPGDTPVIDAPDKLPIPVLAELGSKKVYDKVIATNETVSWPEGRPDSVTFSRFSSDGRYYVYINSPIETNSNGLPISGDETVGMIDFETGKNIPLVSKMLSFPDANFFASPTVAPDGNSIMFVAYWENSAYLVKVDIATKKIQRLEVGKLLTGFGFPDISINGQIVVICDKVSNSKAVSELCLLDENGKFIRYLTDEGYPWPGYGLFTPDGEWVVYASRSKLYKIRIDGSERQEVAPCSLMGPLLVTQHHAVTECRISEQPACQAAFVASLDGKEFWRLGYLEPMCEVE
jgi:hypothetical protein